MTVPDYQSIMLPLLQFASDRQEHAHREATEAVAERLGLTESDLRELLPSGRQPTFENRFTWARTYLTKARLLETPARGRFRITRRGLDFLAGHPDGIKSRMLQEFPEFREFQSIQRQPQQSTNNAADGSSQSPEELLETSYLRVRQQVEQDLLERVKTTSPKFFERLVVHLLVKMGYGGSLKDAGRVVGQSGDGGIDGIIKEDRLGLDNIFIQAKRWDGPVGRPEVQRFAGSLDGQRARKGVYITTSTFTEDAKRYVDQIEKKIVLIDGAGLALLMFDNGVGVADVARYEAKRVDLDFFTEEA